MTKRNRDLARRGTGSLAAGSGQATSSAGRVTAARGGTVVHRVVPAQLACRIGARARAGERNAWPAVISIALGSFALVFSEVIPVGLLADISGHLGVSIGTGGLMVVVPAVAAAVAAPLLALCSARLERRAVLVGLSALVLASDVIGGIAPGIGVMLAARAVLGVCVGGFWVFGAGAAISLVSERARGTAVAVVSSGIFIATVASLPAASLIGTLTTWRAAFAVATVFALIAVAAQLAAVPRLGPGGRVRPRSLLTVVTRPVPRIGLIAAAAIFFANFAAYVTVRSHLRATLMGSGLLIACSALLLATVTGARPLTIALVVVWGLGFGAVPVAAQSWMARAVPASLEGGLALFVSALQGSLAAGSAAGGVIYDEKGPGGALLLAAAVAAAGSLALLGRAGAAISAALAGSADPPASRAGKRWHRRTTRPVEQEPAHTDHAEVAVRGHTAATRKELPCPTTRKELLCPTRL